MKTNETGRTRGQTLSWAVVLLLAAGGTSRAWAEPALLPPPIPSAEQPEVLNRGPVHEAFAGPVNLQPQDLLTAPRPPPPAVQELQPDRAYEAQGLTWVPGYWAWDEDAAGYIWISGCWRTAPPGMTWAPGYWAPQQDGVVWVQGYWKPLDTGEPAYLPPPPEPEPEPPAPAPYENHLWVPSCGYWMENEYVVRPGYWLQAEPDWVWTPSHYIWTPYGYVFVPGYWDYTLEQRGVLYAPVRYTETAAFYSRPVFVPSVRLDLGLLTISLFAFPRYGHYYFGDYHHDSYRSWGLFPWFDCLFARTWHDPVFRHSRWRTRRSDPDWEPRQRREYDTRRVKSLSTTKFHQPVVPAPTTVKIVERAATPRAPGPAVGPTPKPPKASSPSVNPKPTDKFHQPVAPARATVKIVERAATPRAPGPAVGHTPKPPKASSRAVTPNPPAAFHQPVAPTRPTVKIDERRATPKSPGPSVIQRPKPTKTPSPAPRVTPTAPTRAVPAPAPVTPRATQPNPAGKKDASPVFKSGSTPNFSQPVVAPRSSGADKGVGKGADKRAMKRP